MITYASIFLSHSSKDKPLVEAVARELGRRGILAWLDKDELYPGLALAKALTEAIKRQSAVAVFLSPESVKAPWVDDELEIAFKVEETSGGGNIVIPICLGDALDLVKSQPRLRTRLLHPEGDRVNRIYIVPQKSADTETMARDIASQLQRSIFARLKVNAYRDVLICVDQRGNGQRRGEPEIPPNLRNDLDVIGLVFRPDRGMRSQEETLFAEQWEEARQAMESGLAEALGAPRWFDPKRLYILGNAQTGFFYLLGRHFNRNTSARLYCTNPGQPTLSNGSQPIGATQLSGGNPHCETAHSDIAPMAPGSKHEIVSLLLAPEKYVAPVQQFRASSDNGSPLVWVKSDWFSDSDQVMAYIADVVALLSRLRAEHSVRTVCLYNALPISVVPLLSANLLHAVDNIVFMEYRRDLQGKQPHAAETYVALEF